jgi:hypothetical protein
LLDDVTHSQRLDEPLALPIEIEPEYVRPGLNRNKCVFEVRDATDFYDCHDTST